MQFNSETNNKDLISDITFLLGNIGTSEYSLKDRARNMDERFRQVWQWIFASYGGWQFVDDNTSDISTFPYAEVNITSGTAVYVLPSGTLTIHGVEVKDSNSVFHVVRPTTYEEIREVEGVDDFMSTDGTPQWYVPHGDVLEFFPAPNFTVTNGIRVYFDRDIATFAPTGADTTLKIPSAPAVPLTTKSEVSGEAF